MDNKYVVRFEFEGLNQIYFYAPGCRLTTHVNKAHQFDEPDLAEATAKSAADKVSNWPCETFITMNVQRQDGQWREMTRQRATRVSAVRRSEAISIRREEQHALVFV